MAKALSGHRAGVLLCVVSILRINGKIDVMVWWSATAILVYLNSSLNPILHCWKIKEVRQAVKDTIRQFCCFSS